MNLSEISENSEFILKEIKLANPEQLQLFLDSGILPGRKMKLIQKNINSDKIILEIANGKIAIRYSDSKYLEAL